MHCPRPSALKYSSLQWTAPGGWKSLDKPLASSVKRFRKAQWQGIHLGEVICQYESAGGSSFPIEIQRLAGKIVFEPKGDGWKSHSAGVKTCFSANIKRCPFYEKAEEKKKSYPEMYKEIFPNS